MLFNKVVCFLTQREIVISAGEGNAPYFSWPGCFRMLDNKFLVSVLTCIIFCVGLNMESAAVRPPLKPLYIEKFREMIADAEVIAIGTVTYVTFSKTLGPPLETVVTHITLTAEKIIKGNTAMETIEIEESYQQFSMDEAENVPEGTHVTGKDVTARRAGPAPPVGRYRDGTRILVFLKSIVGSKQYRPLGSGSHDAYLGVFQITSEGVKSDRYRFDEIVSGHAKSEAGFIYFIISMTGG